MSLRDDIVRVAREQIGKPYDERYSFPWEGPASDYDSFNCSGLVRAVYDECGVTIPGFQRASIGDSQSRWVMDAGNWHWTPADGLQPGDLVFWQDGEDWTDTYHVGIYTGDEMCVSANGPRMGVCEHYVWIDSNFIGGGWPLDWTDGWDDPDKRRREQEEREVAERRAKEIREMQPVINDGGDVYRLYNPNDGNHLFTTNASERDALVQAGWRDEGVAWTAHVGQYAVYRLYNPGNSDHLLTTGFDEARSCVEAGWTYEGVPFMASKAGIEVFRLYNPYSGQHMYTASASERDTLCSVGWKVEGSFCA